MLFYLRTHTTLPTELFVLARWHFCGHGTTLFLPPPLRVEYVPPEGVFPDI